MTTAVKRENGRVWIDGVEGFDTSEYASSVHGAQARILQALEEPLTYEDLVGYSGFAFRIGVHEAMCPSAGHPCCGYMCLDNGMRAIPWQMELFESFPWDEPKADQEAFEAGSCAAIKESIDRGLPVHYGGEEDGLIIGYADEGRRWWCLHPYHKDAKTPFWHDEAEGFAGGTWPWGIVVWRQAKPADQRVAGEGLLQTALEQAVTMWETNKVEQYFCGNAAYEHWLDWLRGVEAGTVEDPKAGMQGNGWVFDVLTHSRRIAGPWLEQKAGVLGQGAREHLEAAAAHYRQMAEDLTAGLDCPWNLAVPPKRAGEWTGAMRQDQIRRIEAAREHDRAALAAVKAALAVSGTPV